MNSVFTFSIFQYVRLLHYVRHLNKRMCMYVLSSVWSMQSFSFRGTKYHNGATHLV